MKENEITIIKNTDFSFYFDNVLGTIYPNTTKIQAERIEPTFQKFNMLYNRKILYFACKTQIHFIHEDKTKKVNNLEDLKTHKADILINIPINNIIEHEQRKEPISKNELNNILDQFKNTDKKEIILNNGLTIYNTDTQAEIKHKLRFTGFLIQRAPTKEELKNLNALYKFILYSANNKIIKSNENEITIKTSILNYKKFKDYAETTKTITLIKNIINNLDILKQTSITILSDPIFKNNIKHYANIESFNILNSFSIINDKEIIINLNANFYNKLLSNRVISKYEYIGNNSYINNLASYIMNSKNILKDKIKSNGYLKINLLELYGYLKGFDCREITDYTRYRHYEIQDLNKNIDCIDFYDYLEKKEKQNKEFESLINIFNKYYDEELKPKIYPNMTDQEKEKEETEKRIKRQRDKDLINNTIDELNKNNEEFKIIKCYIKRIYNEYGKEINALKIEDPKANRFINDDEIKAKLTAKYPNKKHADILKLDRFKDFIFESYILVKFF